MYQDYLNEIMHFYRLGQNTASLPQRLVQPTPAGIKKECIRICETRFDQKDLRVLNAFFKTETDQVALLKVICKCSIDRFKPLANFLKQRTGATDDLNIELLAWLIDFPRRPYKASDYPATASEPDTAEQAESIRHNEINDGTAETVSVDETESFVDDITDAATPPAVPAPVFFSRTWKRAVTLIAGIFILLLLSMNFSGRKKDPGLSYVSPLQTDSSHQLTYIRDNLLVQAGTTAVEYLRCTGNSPCKACSNCSSCNWCRTGGTCGVCSDTKKRESPKRSAQCLATTKKGKQCSRAAKTGGKYCWQHVRRAA